MRAVDARGDNLSYTQWRPCLAVSGRDKTGKEGVMMKAFVGVNWKERWQRSSLMKKKINKINDQRDLVILT